MEVWWSFKTLKQFQKLLIGGDEVLMPKMIIENNIWSLNFGSFVMQFIGLLCAFVALTYLTNYIKKLSISSLNDTTIYWHQVPYDNNWQHVKRIIKSNTNN